VRHLIEYENEENRLFQSEPLESTPLASMNTRRELASRWKTIILAAWQKRPLLKMVGLTCRSAGTRGNASAAGTPTNTTGQMSRQTSQTARQIDQMARQRGQINWQMGYGKWQFGPMD
jgi:hypothetical protein